MPEECVSEQRLVSRAKNGDARALACLYDQYSGALHAVAYRIMACPSDADDIVHDLFAGLPRALASYQNRGSFVGWLKKCTVRLALMRLRKERREVHFDSTAHAAATGLPSDLIVDQIVLTNALRRLPADLRVVVVLRDVEGYSHKEIGELLDITAGNSAVRVHRARRQLRKLLGHS